jgi:hypothetical protein
MGCCRIALQAATMAGQQNEREIRPRGLRDNPLRKLPTLAAIHGFLGQDGDATPVHDPPSELDEVGADKVFDMRLTQNTCSHSGVSPSRREDECTLRISWPD